MLRQSNGEQPLEDTRRTTTKPSHERKLVRVTNLHKRPHYHMNVESRTINTKTVIANHETLVELRLIEENKFITSKTTTTHQLTIVSVMDQCEEMATTS